MTYLVIVRQRDRVNRYYKVEANSKAEARKKVKITGSNKNIKKSAILMK